MLWMTELEPLRLNDDAADWWCFSVSLIMGRRKKLALRLALTPYYIAASLKMLSAEALIWPTLRLFLSPMEVHGFWMITPN